MNIKNTILSLAASTFMFALASGVPSHAFAAGWYNCQPIASFEMNEGQIQVQCSNNFISGVNFIGLLQSSYSDAAETRFFSAANAAILSGRRFRVYMTDTVCPGFSNCRLANSWSLYIP
jgi:hypothetical protein